MIQFILDPWYRGGANHPSLVEAQENFQRFGACDENGKLYVREVRLSDEKDPIWRPVKENDRKFVTSPKELNESEWNDVRSWYYWLKSREEAIR